MTPAAHAAEIDDDALAAIRAHPAFRGACESAASRAVAHYLSLEPTHQWISKDLGRAAICMTALTLHLMDRLTVQNLTANCLAGGISSAGRVNQVVRRCQDVGAMRLDDGEGLWTRRRIRLSPRMVDEMRRRALVDMTAAFAVAPGIAEVMDIVATDEGFVSYIIAVAAITNVRRDLFAFSGKSPVSFFLDREAGMSILFDLIGAQAADRERLLEAAPISRYALSRRYSISRAHINKMLAESGHIDAEEVDRIGFSPALSEAMEAHFALIFELNRRAAEAVLSGWRFRPRAAA
jgi:hypothetical protein